VATDAINTAYRIARRNDAACGDGLRGRQIGSIFRTTGTPPAASGSMATGIDSQGDLSFYLTDHTHDIRDLSDFDIESVTRVTPGFDGPIRW
jgi:hypothetical protein